MNETDSVFDGGWKIDTDGNTLVSYLWEQADRPEVVRAVTIAVFNTHTDLKARAVIAATLTALLGPRPTEQESHDE